MSSIVVVSRALVPRSSFELRTRRPRRRIWQEIRRWGLTPLGPTDCATARLCGLVSTHLAHGLPTAILGIFGLALRETKAPYLRSFCPIAGAGFERATFGL